MTLTPSNATPSYGDALTLTAQIAVTSPGTGPATGNVQFLIDGKPEGTAVAVQPNGSATCTPAKTLKAGTHKIAAIYPGNASFGHSQAVYDLTVAKAATTTALVSSGNPSAPGAPVTFTATVTRTGGPAGESPTGRVVFFEPATKWECSIKLAGGQAVCVPVASLPSGANTFEAHYFADENYDKSNAPITQNVTPGANPQAVANIAINPSTKPVKVGDAVHFIATLAAANPSLGGADRDGSVSSGRNPIRAAGAGYRPQGG
jgi:hypothetical protein